MILAPYRRITWLFIRIKKYIWGEKPYLCIAILSVKLILCIKPPFRLWICNFAQTKTFALRHWRIQLFRWTYLWIFLGVLLKYCVFHIQHNALFLIKKSAKEIKWSVKFSSCNGEKICCSRWSREKRTFSQMKLFLVLFNDSEKYVLTTKRRASPRELSFTPNERRPLFMPGTKGRKKETKWNKILRQNQTGE